MTTHMCFCCCCLVCFVWHAILSVSFVLYLLYCIMPQQEHTKCNRFLDYNLPNWSFAHMYASKENQLSFDQKAFSFKRHFYQYIHQQQQQQKLSADMKYFNVANELAFLVFESDKKCTNCRICRYWLNDMKTYEWVNGKKSPSSVVAITGSNGFSLAMPK